MTLARFGRLSTVLDDQAICGQLFRFIERVQEAAITLAEDQNARSLPAGETSKSTWLPISVRSPPS